MEMIGHISTVEVFKFRTNPATWQCYLDYIDITIKNATQTEIFHHNLHTLYHYFRDPSVSALYRDAIVMIDGMPIIWLLRLAGFKVKRQHRITWVDFIWPLLECAQAHNWRVFYLGSSQDVLDAGFAHIKERLPGLSIEGHHGYYNDMPGSVENQQIVKQINDFGPDLCLVGMGTPRQERWVMHHRSLLHVPAILVSGACMEYLAGSVRTPPRWMGYYGLEWSYRFIENPRRFAYRYLAEPWILFSMLFWRHFKK